MGLDLPGWGRHLPGSMSAGIGPQLQKDTACRVADGAWGIRCREVG